MQLTNIIEPYLNLNLSIIGVEHIDNKDKSKQKRPWHQWKKYTTERPTIQEAEQNLSQAKRVGIVCGSASDNLEVIDIDDSSIYDDFYSLLLEYFEYQSSFILTVKTRKGYHIYFRNEFDMSDPPEEISNCGSQKLANHAKDEDGNRLPRIETRGQGGYVVAPPSEGYTLMNGATFDNIPTWGIADRQAVFAIARSFNLDVVNMDTRKAAKVNNDYKNTPWNEYNHDERDPWLPLLIERGWQIVSAKDAERTYFLRPGDAESEQSGNFHHDKRIFWVWSTSTELEPSKAYTPALLRCQLIYGDLSAESLSQNTEDLISEGYGQKWNRQEKGAINKATKIVGENISLSRDQLLDLMKQNINTFHLIEDAPVIEIAKKKLEKKQERKQTTNKKIKAIVDHWDNKNVRLNLVTNKLEYQNGQVVDAIEYNTNYLEIIEKVKVSKDLIDTVALSHYIDSFHPFREYFDSLEALPLENHGYIDKILESLNLELSAVKHIEHQGKKAAIDEREVVKSLFIKWMLQFFASAEHVGPLDIMLVLTGGQNNGKSHFFKYLLPKELRTQYVNVIQDFPNKEEDAKMMMINYIMTLRDDIKGAGTKDAAWQKYILSAEKLTFRAPYGKVMMDYKRYAVLCATSNEINVIPDDDTNRRIFPIEVKNRIDRDLYNEVTDDTTAPLWREVKWHWEQAGLSKRQKRDAFKVDDVEVMYLSSLDGMVDKDNMEDVVLQYIAKPHIDDEGFYHIHRDGVPVASTERPYMTFGDIKLHLFNRAPWTSRLSGTKLGKILNRNFESFRMRVNGKISKVYECYKLDLYRTDLDVVDIDSEDVNEGVAEVAPDDDLPF